MKKNNSFQPYEIDKKTRSKLMNQTPCVLWITGISGAGKSTLANALEKKLHSLGKYSYVLDGDNVRNGLNKDLNFSDVDRKENIRRIAEVAKLMVDSGLIVITAFISPFRNDRQMARNLFSKKEFIEIFLDTPIEIAEKRDVKGLYKKARAGEVKDFTGIDSSYEAPILAELTLSPSQFIEDDLVLRVINLLESRNIL